MTTWRGLRQEDTGLVWMGARYYDSARGRFLSTDPVGHSGSLSLYDYAGGDPVNFVDPDGRLQKVAAAAQTPQLFSWQGMIEQKLALSVYSANAPSPIPRPTYSTLSTIPTQQPTTWRGMASQALDLLPVVGTAKAGIEVATGYDIVGGRCLSSQERTMAGVSFSVGVATMGGAGGVAGGLSRAAIKAEVPLANRGFKSIAANSTLSAGRRVGWATPIPKYDVNAPWWKPVTPRFSVNADVVTEGRTAAQIFATKVHEGQHIKDILNHPQMTHLATQKGFFPGAGAARYWMEYRGYSAAGQMQNLATPLRSFNQAQKINLAMDVGIFGVGGAAAGYSIYDYLNN